MYPLKNRKWRFFGFNMKLSICLDNTRKISKFPPWGSGERKGDYLQTFRTFSKKISNIVSKIEIFLKKSGKSVKIVFHFPPFPRKEFGNFSCIVFSHTYLHVQAKKSPFWIFQWVHDGPFSLLCYVKGAWWLCLVA